MDKPKAKVFISCGQATDEERAVAKDVSNYLITLGFEPYLAIYEQSLRGLKENIFDQLQSSEYFLFIDFKREQLKEQSVNSFLSLISKSRYSSHRGSLFTNQELALAALLDLPIIAIQEHGVKPLDGLLGFLQTNSEKFSDRSQIKSIVEGQIIAQGWDPNWKNQLVFRRDPLQHDDIGGPYEENGVRIKDFTYRMYHIGVVNLHKSKPAINCTIQLKTAIDNVTGDQIPFDEAYDFRWAGIDQVSAVISPGIKRYFDACKFWPEDPSRIDFSLATNYENLKERFRKNFIGRFDLQLTFTVRAENFPTSEAAFRLRHGKTLNDVILEEA